MFEVSVAFRRACARASLAAVALVGLAPAAVAADLVVDLKTDYRPYADFIAVRTRLQPFPTPTTVETRTQTAFETDVYFPTPRRVAEFQDVAPGVYDVVVELLDQRGDLRSRWPVRADVGPGATEVLVLAGRPEGVAKKTASLLIDRDGDGEVGLGDVLRYTVGLTGRGGDEFSDQPGAGSRLVTGSVTTSHGTVTSGNASGDSVVRVSGLAMGDGEDATIQFDAELKPVVENQGRFRISRPGPVSADFLTDDPRTEQPGDPTVTEVTCGVATCRGELEECRLRLTACESERQALKDQLTAAQVQLAELLGDPDADGIPAVLDRCAGTPGSAPVDERGCSRAQFCERIPLTLPLGPALCRAADWRDDEPLLAAPRDCQPSLGRCRAL